MGARVEWEGPTRARQSHEKPSAERATKRASDAGGGELERQLAFERVEHARERSYGDAKVGARARRRQWMRKL